MLSLIIMAVKVSVLIWGTAFVYGKLINPVDAAWVRDKAARMMIAFYAAGMLAHSVWLFYLILIVTLPMIARSRAEGAALYVVAIGAVPELATGLVAGDMLIITVDKWVCLSLGLLIVFLSKPRSGLPTSGRFDIPFLLIFALDLVQARDQNFTSTVRVLLSSVLTMGVPYFVFSRSIGKLEDVRRIMMAFAFIGFALAVIAVFESRTSFFVYQQMYGSLNVEGIGYKVYKMRGGVLRAVTSFGEATSFSIFLSMTLMATLALRGSFRSTIKLVAAVAVICLGMFVTGSRNAWLSCAIAILAFDLYRRRKMALAGKAAVLAMGYAVLQLLAEFIPYVNIMLGHSADTAGTTDYRSQLFTRGMEEFWKHPIAGLDIASVTLAMEDLRQGEGIVDFTNGYLLYALTAGVGGAIALALTFVLPAWAMLRSRERLSQLALTDRTAAFIFSVCAATLVNNAFGGTGGRGSMYFYIVLALAANLHAWRRFPVATLAATDVKIVPRPPQPLNVMLLTPAPEPVPA